MVHPTGVVGIIIDTWQYPNSRGDGFRVFFPGTAHRSEHPFDDVHVKYAAELEVISEAAA